MKETTVTPMEALRADVVLSKGVLTVPVARLTEAYGTEHWNVTVRRNISNALASCGIAHIPKRLPENKFDNVRLYQRGSQIEAIVEATYTPGSKGDEIIRKICDPEPSKELLTKIRSLLG